MNTPPSRDLTGRIAATSLSLTAGGFYSPRQSLTRGDSPSRNQPSMPAAAGGFMVAAMAEPAARPAESVNSAGRSQGSGKPNTYPNAAFRRLWLDASLSVAEVARICGYAGQSPAKAVHTRAAKLGLPPRAPEKCGRKPRITDIAKFTALLAEGFTHRQIAREFRTTPQTVGATIKRCGLTQWRAAA